MSRPIISSSERRGIIILLVIIALSVLAAGVRRCTVRSNTTRLYQARKAHIDSVSAVLADSTGHFLSTPDESSQLADTVPGSIHMDSQHKSRLRKSGKGKTTRRKSSAPVPSRSPMDEPVN